MKLYIAHSATPPLDGIGQLTVFSTAALTLTAGANDADAVLVINATPLVIPVADPHVNGAIWNNAGTLTISSG